MGFCVSIYAVFDREISDIYTDLGLQPNGNKEEIPDSPVAYARTKAGVYLLHFNDRQAFGPDMILPVLKSSRVLECNVNETCMHSVVASYNEGHEEWRVVHDANEGVDHLEACGRLPQRYPALLEQKLAQQNDDGEGVDHLFDVPVELFASLVGFRYFEDIDSADDTPWHTLVPIAKSKKQWWPF